MGNKCILSKKVLLLICLFESWIKKYHKEKKIKYVIAINIVFSLFISLALSIFTYLFIVYYIYMSVKENVRNTYALFKFSSFRSITLVYFIILIIVCFQNLFDENFNIASKFKLLILALFKDVPINGLIRIMGKVIFLYIGGYIVLTYAIATAFDPYIGTLITNDAVIKNIIYGALILSLIIIFLIKVYGINDLFRRSRRKVVIYSISTIISAITTLNSASGIASGQETSYIISIEFVGLAIALILSVDKLASSLKEMVKEYNNIYQHNLCKSCIIENLSIENLYNRIKYFIIDKLGLLKSYYQYIKGLSFFRRIFLCLYLVVIIPIAFKYITTEKIGKLLTEVDRIFTRGIYGISSLIEEKTKFKVDYFYNFIILILKGLFVFMIIIIGITCVAKAVSSFKTISNQIKNRKKNKISYENLYKELINFGVSTCFGTMIFMFPFALFDSPILGFTKLVFNFLFPILIITFVSALICWVFIKINAKVEEYKKGN